MTPTNPIPQRSAPPPPIPKRPASPTMPNREQAIADINKTPQDILGTRSLINTSESGLIAPAATRKRSLIGSAS